MKVLLPLLFATLAAAGNALFALGQKQSAGVNNGLFFTALTALLAGLLALLCAPFFGATNAVSLVRENYQALLLSGVGLFLTYLGFNLLYSRFGVSQYILYAVISILTTTVVVGVLWLKEPTNGWLLAAVGTALLSVVLFSMGQRG